MNELIEPDLLSAAFTQASRLLVAAILTGAIGFERERNEHDAGLRTHMLVGIGACVFTLLMVQLIHRFEGDDIRSDPIRIVEAITAGVAFLAAGAIIQARGQVRGLTTGASLWLAGAVGLACGLGEYVLAIIAVVMTLIILRLVKLLE
ncbi:MgtC/SapB family protein [Aurantimonas endophytica]|uniref:Protein MgtC n=1 Tax=Aurantimonas endophytica TaxID=1522175 RepID=A0A7W6HBY6_9HYPH|nr:MgtC/SapB family protein [Aurantimonas endophytica]MBB4002346.1 putative Mg2+ transporter-C (MgtC) family protein [Aurantimonas endophytica]MCO6402030.1 MgtC/SapB family protein [Aurantimonas endophytica]